jgi:hypothetical protein
MKNVMPANSDVPCACCGRVHRKLYLTDGHWLGQNCREDYKLYKQYPNKGAIVWLGYERKYAKVKAMVNAH